jgi:hypothetical protein
VSGNLPVNDNERKIGQTVGDDNLDHGVTVATSRERMAATTARRRAGLAQFVVTMPPSDRDEIARAGYEAIAGDDERAAAEAPAPLHQRHRCLPRPQRVTAQRIWLRRNATPLPAPVAVSLEVMAHRLGRPRLRRRVGEHPAPVLDRGLQQVPFEEDPVLIPAR